MLDLKKPIEAVHIATGRVVPVTFLRFNLNGFETKECPDPNTTNKQWYRDGRDYCYQNQWRVRNKEPVVTNDTDNNPPEWAMKEARRRIATEYISLHPQSKTDPSGKHFSSAVVKPLAEMIAKHEEAPDDPDELAVVELLNVYMGVNRTLSYYRNSPGACQAFDDMVKKYKELKEKSSA